MKYGTGINHSAGGKGVEVTLQYTCRKNEDRWHRIDLKVVPFQEPYKGRIWKLLSSIFPLFFSPAQPFELRLRAAEKEFKQRAERLQSAVDQRDRSACVNC